MSDTVKSLYYCGRELGFELRTAHIKSADLSDTLRRSGTP